MDSIKLAQKNNHLLSLVNTVMKLQVRRKDHPSCYQCVKNSSAPWSLFVCLFFATNANNAYVSK
jgi:hypothetical protein